MEELVTTARPCPSGRPDHTGVRVWRVREWDMYRCRACKHLWIDPIPTLDALSAFYNEGYFHGDASKRGYIDYDKDKQSMKNEFDYFLDRIERHTATRGRLLDIGTATGVFIRMAGERGWRASGVELSEHAATVARGRGLDVVTGTLEAHRERFRGVDVVTMWDVVEHVQDPFAFFRLLHDCLSPDGIVMFATPQSDCWFARRMGSWWTLIAPPQHIHYFSLRSMKECLADAGFECMNVEYRGKDFQLAYIVHFVMGWLGIEWAWLRRFIERPFLQRASIRINPHDMMIVTARLSTVSTDAGRV